VSLTTADAAAKLLSFIQDKLLNAGKLGQTAAKKIDERLNTIAFQIRLPLPTDRSCNQTPLKDRWIVAPESYLTAEDPRYASEEDCLAIKAKLLAEACEFSGITHVHADVVEAVEQVLGRPFKPGAARDIITGEQLTLADLVLGSTVSTNQVGSAEFSVEYKKPLSAGGHLNPLTRGGKHDRGNVVWMSDAGNRIQGNDTFDEIVALIQKAADYHRQRLGIK
jgi:hypothetical protein